VLDLRSLAVLGFGLALAPGAACSAGSDDAYGGAFGSGVPASTATGASAGATSGVTDGETGGGANTTAATTTSAGTTSASSTDAGTTAVSTSGSTGGSASTSSSTGTSSTSGTITTAMETGPTTSGAGTSSTGGGGPLDPGLDVPPDGAPCSPPGASCDDNGDFGVCRFVSPTAGACETCVGCGNLNAPCSSGLDCDILFACYLGRCTNICPLGTSFCGPVDDCIDIGHETHGVCRPF
jgi:hypothetical protein